MEKKISDHAAAAKMIRQYMKANGFVGRVNAEAYSMGSSVRIYVQDLPPARAKQLEDYAGQFEYGRFDGMQDLYEYNNVRKDIPQVKYVFVNNEMSAEMRQKIWDFVKVYFNGLEGAPENAEDAGNYRVQNFGIYGNQLIYQAFKGGYMNEYFWNFVNDVEKKVA